MRQRRMGGAADDPVSRLVGTLSGLGAELGAIRDFVLRAASTRAAARAPIPPPPPAPVVAHASPPSASTHGGGSGHPKR